MADLDVVNGDADGLCAWVQLRLVAPRDSRLVTGVKRDIRLLDRVTAGAGDRVTVLDISLDSNRQALLHLLGAGARVDYFDHHHTGEIPEAEGLSAFIDTAPDTCTSLLVDRHLAGARRLWAIAGAFGDNLHEAGIRLAGECSLDRTRIATLRALGEAINYNAYGETLEDLRYRPDDLARCLLDAADPFDFAAGSDQFRTLAAGMAEDLDRARGLTPLAASANSAAYLLPDAAWSRRVSGVFANELARANPEQAHAILSRQSSGEGCTVSVRAPKARPTGADALCRQFPTGGGRSAAAGINLLPESALPGFLDAFQRHFAGTGKRA